MPNSISVVQPAVLKENKMTINSFLKQSYKQAKKQVEDGVSIIQESGNFIRGEISSFFYETGQCLAIMSLPVNNFLKDTTQIETELLQEVSKESSNYLLMDGEMVPVEKVLSGPMEENY